MGLLFGKRILIYFILLLITGAVFTYLAFVPYFTPNDVADSAFVGRGTVSYVVKISGRVEAKQTATLGFPVSGIVQNVYKQEGDHVMQGDVLASIVRDSLVADYDAILAELRYLENTRAELLRGPEETERAVTQTNVAIARESLARTEAEQKLIVANALQKLRSTDLEALPTSKTNNDTPPLISGNYFCEREGTYTLTLYGSKSPTEMSYTLSGLEEGTFTGFVDAPAPLGTCGLRIQFDADEQYRPQQWTISVPNTRGASYLDNLHNYNVALQQEKDAVAAARESLELAEKTEADLNASPSQLALNKIDAQIAQTRSNLSAQEAIIANYTIRAPFDGMLTDIDIKTGEPARTDRGIVMIKEGQYELKARISEVDITKVHIGDTVVAIFDAASNEKVAGKIEFISPRSSQIDGVAYYEARVVLENEPVWIREGLNADIDIIIAQREDVSTLYKHFVFYEGNNTFVYVKNGDEILKTLVQIGLIGNGGMVEVLDLPRGTEVTRPK